MTCREVIEFMMAYDDKELSAEVRAEFDRHMGVCRACRNFMDNYRKTIALGKAAFADESADARTVVPPDLLKAIRAAIHPQS